VTVATGWSRASVEAFLYDEAELLDAWRLEEWLGLFEPDAVYEVPPTDRRDGGPDDTLYLIADDMVTLRARVDRLLSKSAFAESPPSRTRRLVSNVRVRAGSRPDTVEVDANFAVYRMKHHAVDLYVGRYRHVLRVAEDVLRFTVRRAELDLESLRPAGGKVSIIL
jgi:p-cumate 2,3-dioxygenase beta subunit